MPFKSAKQRRYLYAEKPEVAKKFAMDSAKKGKLAKLKKGDSVDTGDFGSEAANDASLSAGNQSVGYGGSDGDPRTGGGVTTGPATVTVNPGPRQIPTIGPLSWGINKVLKSSWQSKNEKTAREEDLLGGEMQTTGNVATGPAGGGGEGGGQKNKKCPDGSNPPCKTTAKKTTKSKPVVKPVQQFDNFKAYKKGKMISTQNKVNGVVTALKKASKLHAGQAKTLSKLKLNKGGGVPYGPPPLRGPNPQVPPVKFSRGGGAALRGLKFTGVK